MGVSTSKVSLYMTELIGYFRKGTAKGNRGKLVDIVDVSQKTLNDIPGFS